LEIFGVVENPPKEENMVDSWNWKKLAGNYHQTSILEALFLSGWCYIIYFGNQMLVKAPVFFFQNK